MPAATRDQRKTNLQPSAEVACYHCGEPCDDVHIGFDEKSFCCTGCQTVYEILNANDLCRYYDLDETAGISLKGKAKAEYAFLDDPDLRERLIDFTDGTHTRITFYLPQIHCASCIWLLENLYKLNEEVRDSKVNFTKKELYLSYAEGPHALRRIVELLDRIGYAPAINLGDLDEDARPLVERSFYYKLGVAGFAFGNIMLLSFPEYLGLDKAADSFFFRLFGYLNIGLALPVVFYSARDYLQSAWLGLQQRQLNIDVPIALGILTLFGRSLYEILSHTGAGYLDSLAGLVFFLLVGKWFQQRTYHNISFERDYKSYFPIAAQRKGEQGWKTVSLDKLEPGDVIRVRHGELIPADSVLLRGEAKIDYSFVTGESEPVHKTTGEKLYAGGRQTGQLIELSLTRKVSQSYLTQLWNDEAFAKSRESNASKLANTVGKYFTAVILLIAFATLAYWLPRDSGTAINAFTAVLIIACPCAVALAVPFIFGNALRILGRHQFYLKNTAVIEALSSFSSVVFDKTGTLTIRERGEVAYEGEALNPEEQRALLAATSASSHPASQQIAQHLSRALNGTPLPRADHWEEVVGRGIRAQFGPLELRLGAPAFMEVSPAAEGRGVHLQLNGRLKGRFHLRSHYRPGTRELMDALREQAGLYLLSGDNDRERPLLEPFFGRGEHLKFEQKPADKLAFIRRLQEQGEQVLMIGDGLNDASALQQSDCGIVVTENTNNFTPASDGILFAGAFQRFPTFLRFARRSIRLVYGAYGIAFVYNVIGLSFAVQGLLSPVVAAILMPLSSITIVLFGTGSSSLLGKRMGL
jgi:Cu+-exporting ATPase